MQRRAREDQLINSPIQPPSALGASIYDVRSRWGEGVPKSRRKEQNQLICDSDKGEGENPEMLWTSYMEAPLVVVVANSALHSAKLSSLEIPTAFSPNRKGGRTDNFVSSRAVFEQLAHKLTE